MLRAGGSSPIAHVIVIVQENRTFDNLFHGFPGANTVGTGIGHGKPYTLQEIPLTWPYDVNHSHAQFLEDYNLGKGDGFDDQIVAMKSPATCTDPINHPVCWIFSQQRAMKRMAYSYVNPARLVPYWQLASQYALGDNTFASNNGPSFEAHQYLIAGQSGHAVDVPSGQPWGCGGSPSQESVELLEYGQAAPPVFSKATGHEVPGPFPCFGYPTIADLLDSAGVSWRYYVQGSGAGANLNGFAAIERVYKRHDWKNVKSPDTKIFADIATGQLANVSWVMPSGHNSDHPGPQSGNLGPSWVASIVNAVGTSAYWNTTAIIVEWDDWGGWYDHVRPPQYLAPDGANEGLGFRVPLIVVSPYAKAGYISHQQHELASSLRFIEETFGLGFIGQASGLPYADQRVANLGEQIDDMFDFTQPPHPFKPIPVQYDRRYFLTHPDTAPADDY